MTDRFSWEKAVRCSPEVVGTRMLVLLTVATYMDNETGKARPSQATLAADVGITDRAVRGHLTSAVMDGWLLLLARGHRLGDGTSVSSIYKAAIPAGAAHEQVASTGTGVPPEDDLNRNGGTGRESLNRNVGAPQPEAGRASTGTGVPPITLGHSWSRERGPHDELAVTARRLVTARREGLDDELVAHLQAVERDYTTDAISASLAALNTNRYV